MPESRVGRRGAASRARPGYRAFPLGSVVWGKLGTYPWWPAKVIGDDALTEEALEANKDDDEIPIQFFGYKYSVCWLTEPFLKDFETHKKEKSRQSKGKRLITAIAEAERFLKSKKNPSSKNNGSSDEKHHTGSDASSTSSGSNTSSGTGEGHDTSSSGSNSDDVDEASSTGENSSESSEITTPRRGRRPIKRQHDNVHRESSKEVEEVPVKRGVGRPAGSRNNNNNTQKANDGRSRSKKENNNNDNQRPRKIPTSSMPKLETSGKRLTPPAPPLGTDNPSAGSMLSVISNESDDTPTNRNGIKHGNNNNDDTNNSNANISNGQDVPKVLDKDTRIERKLLRFRFHFQEFMKKVNACSTDNTKLDPELYKQACDKLSLLEEFECNYEHLKNTKVINQLKLLSRLTGLGDDELNFVKRSRALFFRFHKKDPLNQRRDSVSSIRTDVNPGIDDVNVKKE